VKKLDIGHESQATHELCLTQVCAKCGREINLERRRQVMGMRNLFGIGGGWRLCDCKQSLLKGWGPKKQILDPLKEDWPRQNRSR
jgi:hypothetical protein